MRLLYRMGFLFSCDSIYYCIENVDTVELGVTSTENLYIFTLEGKFSVFYYFESAHEIYNSRYPSRLAERHEALSCISPATLNLRISLNSNLGKPQDRTCKTHLQKQLDA